MDQYLFHHYAALPHEARIVVGSFCSKIQLKIFPTLYTAQIHPRDFSLFWDIENLLGGATFLSRATLRLESFWWWKHAPRKTSPTPFRAGRRVAAMSG